jgi:hypothetical protein
MARSGNARANSPTRVRASSTGVVVPLPPPAETAPAGRSDGSQTAAPPRSRRGPSVAAGGHVSGLRGVVGPERAVDLGAAAAEQAVVGGDVQRRARREQRRHDQPGPTRPSWSADQAWWRTTGARGRGDHGLHPGADQHAGDGARPGLGDHPDRQQAEHRKRPSPPNRIGTPAAARPAKPVPSALEASADPPCQRADVTTADASSSGPKVTQPRSHVVAEGVQRVVGSLAAPVGRMTSAWAAKT